MKSGWYNCFNHILFFCIRSLQLEVPNWLELPITTWSSWTTRTECNTDNAILTEITASCKNLNIPAWSPFFRTVHPLYHSRRVNEIYERTKSQTRPNKEWKLLSNDFWRYQKGPTKMLCYIFVICAGAGKTSVPAWSLRLWTSTEKRKLWYHRSEKVLA